MHGKATAVRLAEAGRLEHGAQLDGHRREHQDALHSSALMRSAASAASASDAYFVRGQKNPRRPSPFVRGTTCTCRCGTDWLTLLLSATKVPCAPMPRSTAPLRSRARWKSGST